MVSNLKSKQTIRFHCRTLKLMTTISVINFSQDMNIHKNKSNQHKSKGDVIIHDSFSP